MNFFGNALENTKEILNCMVFGNCIEREYEYRFYLGNEEIKADECHTGRYSKTYCTVGDVTYNNVSYNSVLIKETPSKNTFFPFLSICVILAIFFHMTMLLLKGRS